MTAAVRFSRVVGDLGAIFKAYDIRGIVGEQIDPQNCRAIGAAFARYVSRAGASRIVLGRDMRPDGAGLSAAFAYGAVEAGANVTDIGLCATEMLYFASGLLDAPGAMFTASHNPAGYNGIKLCGARAAPIGADTGLAEIKSLAENEIAETSGASARRRPPAVAQGSITERGLLGEFAAHALSFVDTAAFRPLRVVVDAANGMAGLVAPAVLKRLPVELDLLYGELDGTFPNHPADPLRPENLRDLQARVLSASADVGMGFDGDADRVFFVDDAGAVLSGSVTTALIAEAMLAREPGANIVHNLICSKAVPEVIAEHGGTAVRCRVGHSFVKQAMASTSAIFGGEHSGHYYFRHHYGADSAMLAALAVLEALSRRGGTLSEMAVPLRRYAASGEINTAVGDVDGALRRVADAFSHRPLDRLDGLTVDCGEWWFNLRPSNTEPLLRLNLEAATPEEVSARVSEVRGLFL